MKRNRILILGAVALVIVLAFVFWPKGSGIGKGGDEASASMEPQERAQLVEDFCKPKPETAGYVTPDEIAGIRTMIQENDPLYSSLSSDDKKVLAHALEIAPQRAFFAARALRTFAIAGALEHVSKCDVSAGSCAIPPQIDHLKGRIKGLSPDGDTTWAKLAGAWKGYLAEDLDHGKVCAGS